MGSQYVHSATQTWGRRTMEILTQSVVRMALPILDYQMPDPIHAENAQKAATYLAEIAYSSDCLNSCEITNEILNSVVQIKTDLDSVFMHHRQFDELYQQCKNVLSLCEKLECQACLEGLEGKKYGFELPKPQTTQPEMAAVSVFAPPAGIPQGVQKPTLPAVVPAFQSQVLYNLPQDCDQEFLSVFLTETQEHLDGLETAMLRLESEINKGISDPETLKMAKRILHTLKGNAGAMGMVNLHHDAHVLEDLVQSGGPFIDPVLEFVTHVRRFVVNHQ